MKKLREGFTTGSCAAAAALASAMRLRDGVCPKYVEITVPEGRQYTPEIVECENGFCGVVKFSGDDPDITNGMMITAGVEIIGDEGPVTFSAGEGVGTVTQVGLKVAPGEPAINPVPRQMITDAVRSVFDQAAVRVTVAIPGGREIAKKTFNPRLGIEGGLSVLGTSGVVRPMSEEALCESLRVELEMRVQQGNEEILFTFGMQGEASMQKIFGDKCIVQVSNFVGFMLDSALDLGVKHLIIGGHPGKMSKISAGLMMTHSHTGDTRREAIITQLALKGAPIELMKRIYECVTTDAAIELIDAYGRNEVWTDLAFAAKRYCEARTRGEIDIDTVFIDGSGRVLGSTVGGMV